MLRDIRSRLKQEGFDGIIVPKWDRFRLEFVEPHDDLLSWATGFTGSYGLAIIQQEEATLFVDGRYTTQAKEQAKDFQIYSLQELLNWMGNKLSKKIIFDPWLFSQKDIDLYKKAALQTQFLPYYEFLSLIWQDRPPKNLFEIHYYPYSGKASIDKCLQVTQKLENCDYLLITDPESICWLLNIRDHGRLYNPIVPCFAIMDRTGHVELFLDIEELSIDDIFGNITLYHEEFLIPILQERSKAKFLISSHTPFHLMQSIDNFIYSNNPILLLKAQKNEIELNLTEVCHRRDGAAITEFLYWVENSKEKINELKASDYLYVLRKKHMNFMGNSFPTISATGPNSSIIHYRPFQETARDLQKGDVYLIDSGGQYLGATTDVTRTIIYKGKPSNKLKKEYTLVLKGHIALANACFPKGTTGHQLDALARQFLWKEGLDYAHGTGHGVGNYLNVHEGPQNISTKGSSIPLTPGMIVSIEPGYYKEGEYGIRLENLAYVMDSYYGFLCFKVLTMVPFDPKLVDFDMLTTEEKKWLQLYHRQIRENIYFLISQSCRDFVDKVCSAFV